MPRAKPPQWSAWTWRWIAVVESLGPEYTSRLAKARSYARNGHIWRLDIQPGKLSAQVLGSYGYYTTAVGVPTLPDALWDEVADWLVDSPLELASLLAGELTPFLELRFERAGASLFPTMIDELAWRCNCPDWERPCKHTLALCYEFADQLEREPALLLTLRGRALDEITAMAQWRWAQRTESANSTPAETATADQAHAQRDTPNLSAFFQAGAALEQFSGAPSAASAPSDTAALLHAIGQPPFAAEREDALTPLLHTYDVMTQQALSALERVRRADEARRKSAGG